MDEGPARSGAARLDRWVAGVVGVVALGVAVRAVYILVVLDDVAPGADAIWYQLQGGSIRQGYGYVVPRTLFTREYLPTAAFPPLYPAFQAMWHLVVGEQPGTDAVRLAGLLPASATIALTAMLGRRIVGRGPALLAASLVALHPGLIASDGSAMSENLTVPLTCAALLLALAVVEADPPRRSVVLAAALGVGLGLAVLTRQDLAVLALLLAGWIGVVLPGRWQPKVAAVAAVGIAASVVIAPWVWRNREVLDVVAVSTLSPTSAVAGANCDRTYAGTSLGSWEYGCVVAARPSQASEEDILRLGLTEAELMDAYQRAAVDHARANVERLPLVLAARQARAWSLWDPGDLAQRDADESRRYGWQVIARPLEALLGVLGGVGVALLVRRRVRGAVLLLAPVVTVAVSVAVGYGNPRFNAIAQPSLMIGLAWVVALVASALRARRSTQGAATTPA